MRSCKEIRREAWNIMVGGRWLWRLLLAGSALYAVFFAVLVAVGGVYELCGVQTWETFKEAQVEAMRAGIDLAVPSAREALRMTLASGFGAFIVLLGKGIVAFGTIAVLLKSLKNEVEGSFACAFDGFKRPFEVLWLMVLQTLKILFWMLPGIVIAQWIPKPLLPCLLPFLLAPGFVAALRYALAWFVKVENPEMGANACIKRSCALMDGRKWKLVVFWLSYFGWFFLAIFTFAFVAGFCGALVAVGAAVGADKGAMPVGAAIPLALAQALVLAVALMLFAFVFIYLSFGGAVFYRDAKAEVEAPPEEPPIDG